MSNYADFVTPHWTDALLTLDACNTALQWARTQPDYATAWATCERGDWMLWLAGRLAGKLGTKSRKRLVAAALDCAKLAWPHVRRRDRAVVQACYDTTARYLRGEATIAEVRAAADAAAYAAAAYAAAANAAAAADAYYAAAAADAAAAYAAVANAERVRVLRQCADLVRRHYPTPPRLPKGEAL
jgi:hypothetical protein